MRARPKTSGEIAAPGGARADQQAMQSICAGLPRNPGGYSHEAGALRGIDDGRAVVDSGVGTCGTLRYHARRDAAVGRDPRWKDDWAHSRAPRRRRKRARRSRSGARPAGATVTEARRTMNNDLVPELPPFQLTEYVRKAFECTTREQLDDLTRRIWHRYGRGAGATVNAAALERLKARILERREMLDGLNHSRPSSATSSRSSAPAKVESID